MKFNTVYIDALGYEIAPNVVTSQDLEAKIEPLYDKLHIQKGQLEAMTGIIERRWWDEGFKVSRGAIQAGESALEASSVRPKDLGMLIYAGVCRDNLEPATACVVADHLKISENAMVYDISNACLGVLNGMIDIARAIELGEIKAGMVVSCESSRQIMEMTLAHLIDDQNMDNFKYTLATMTGGSGAVALILTHADFSDKGHRLMGGAALNAVRHHGLCTWGPDTGIPATRDMVMRTDSVGVLNHGVTLGVKTFKAFHETLKLLPHQPDKVVCHQVGSAHQNTVLNALNISKEKDFVTYPYLGNIGTVSLPITAAIAGERGFFKKGDVIGFCGIGSGLNCIVLGIEW